MSAGRRGVLLMTYGSPADDLRDLPDYLAAVRGGRRPDDETVAEFRRRYELIGGSPLIPNTRRQAAALEAHLRAANIDAVATVGMRFSEPSVAAGLGSLAAAGCATAVAIVMSPQYSELLMAGYRRAVDDAVGALGADAPRVTIAPAWHRQPRFIEAVAARVREGLVGMAADTPVLMTAHSLPRRVADAEPGYLEQLRETAASVAAAAGLTDGRWHFCWQSAGHEPGEWMKPDFTDLLPALRAEGHRSVLVAPIQFLSDHLEILYDVDIGAREQAEAAGMAFARIPALNADRGFIAALSDVVGDASPSAGRQYASGRSA